MYIDIAITHKKSAKMGVEDEYVNPNPLGKFIKSVSNIVNAPVVWFRDDIICCTEAEEQFKRDKRIDAGIVSILRNRMEECNYYERPDHRRKCVKVTQDYNEAANNYFIKWRLGSLWRCGGLLHETKTQNDMGEKTRKGWYWNETKRRMGKRNRRMNFVFEK
ncbi:NADH dehydrogenase [ubiquinone] 1 beta subcomplex subunit 10 [Armadillidium vulgare]|nr:NADH dehydrogenase [ubiquinone] 1 beta subcomplex subunit 10 [Armadillidium vulgare]